MADKDADVRLEKSHAEGDHREPYKEHLRGSFDEQRVATNDERAATHDRALRTEQAVGDPAAEERQEVTSGDEQTVDRAGGLVTDAQPSFGKPAHHEKDKNRPH